METGIPVRGRKRDENVPLRDWLLSETVADLGTGCWLWPGLGNNKGYAVTSVGGRRVLASRVITGCHEGGRDVVVCHRCDNPRCIRPEHLFVGTQQDNINDCIAKGRKTDPPVMRRDNHPNTKIRTSMIPDLVRLRDSGVATNKIGEMIGCSGSIVRRAIRTYDDTSLTTP